MIVEARMVKRYYVVGVYGPEFRGSYYAYQEAAALRYDRKREGAVPQEGVIDRYARWLRRADEREGQS